MPASKKNNRHEQYLLRGKLKRNGFECWRYVFSGINRITGERRVFFVEMYYVNPAISPKKIVVSRKPKPADYADINSVLAQTSSDSPKKEIQPSASSIQPSFFAVRSGFYGENAKLLNCFLPAETLCKVKNEHSFKADDFIFAPDHIKGIISVTRNDLLSNPALSCDQGFISWNLNFEMSVSSGALYDRGKNFYVADGACAVFSGSVNADGQDFSVGPGSSFGFIEKKWGPALRSSLFHLSSSNISSMITGKKLSRACFCLDGEYNGKLVIFSSIDGHVMRLKTKSLFNKFSEIHEWSRTPADADGEKLHWTVSIHKGKIVADIDIYCKTAEMFVRDYEFPSGGNLFLKVLGGGTGFGEIRIYKRAKKDLELLEHAEIKNAVCEYGEVNKI